jgi:DNA repair exonuclease SbcCD ATPase subunit
MSNFRNSFPLLAVLFLVLSLSALMTAQGANAAPPVSYASVNELNGLLDHLKQTSQTVQVDLAKMRVDRWKTDSGTKKQVQTNVDSIQRNLQAALPEMITQLNNSPEDLAASFKLYRNLDALYDVFGTVVGYAEGLGSKDEAQSLTNDMSGLETARRSFGERMQRLAAAKEDELSRLRTQVRTLQAAVAAAPPKKVVVDDTEPPKKPAPKKKPAKPTAKPATTDTTKPPANTPPAQ